MDDVLTDPLGDCPAVIQPEECQLCSCC